jgi:hypothetical protein
MSVAAFVIERRLLKVIRDGGGKKPALPPAGRVTLAHGPAQDDAS